MKKGNAVFLTFQVSNSRNRRVNTTFHLVIKPSFSLSFELHTKLTELNSQKFDCLFKLGPF